MLGTRVATAAVALPLAIAGIVFLSSALVGGVFGALMLVGAWEWAGLLGFDRARRSGFVFCVAAVMAAVTAWPSSAMPATAQNVVLALACVGWLVAIYALLRFSNDGGELTRRGAVGAVSGVVALVAPVVAVTRLHEGHEGGLLLLFFFAFVWAADSGAYFAGRAFGVHKLAARVSPAKTWEGAAGGIVAVLALTGLGGWALGYSGVRIPAFMLLGAWTAGISIVGDLTLSMFKRGAGVKDSGRLFPGHGGVLDRLDSVLAAAPWFVAGLYWLPAQ